MPRAVVQQAARLVEPLEVVPVLPAGERVARPAARQEVVRVVPVVLPAAPQEVVPRLASALRPA